MGTDSGVLEMIPTDKDGEIDFYKLWVQSQKRIAMLEEILKRKDDRILGLT